MIEKQKTSFHCGCCSQPASCGDYNRHRKCLQRENDELRDRLEAAAADSKPIQRVLKEQRGVIHDIHRRLLAVSKGLEKHPL